jgi:uncharacterized protein (TIGR03437 family)
MRFEANRGQAPAPVRFLARGAGYSMFLTPSGAVLDLASRDRGLRRIAWTWIGSDAAGRLDPEARRASVTNYLVGGRNAWRASVENYGRVRHRGVYPGIDVVYYGNQRRLEYDIVVAPHADYSRARFRLDGADSVRIGPAGELVIAAGHGEIRQHPPVAYERTANGRRALAARYRLLPDGEIGFEVDGRDPARALVIDPVLSYSTYFGGSTSESAGGIAVDASGRAYLVGSTSSHDFPTDDQAILPDRTALPYPRQYGYLARINAAGDDILYATYIGGAGGETNANAVAVLPDGTVFLTGTTAAPDFPIVAAYKPRIERNSYGDAIADAFVMRIAPDGRTVQYSTYLGGSDVDEGQSIAVDATGAAYVGGKTASGNFPVPGGVRRTASGIGDAFAVKFTPSGSLAWGTYIGGRGYEDATGIAVDSASNVYVTGTTDSTDFPAAPYPENLGAYAVKISADGARFVWSLVFGPWLSHGRAIAVDSSNNAYVAGWTPSGWYVGTAPSFQKSYGGGRTDAFVVKVNAAGNALLYSTYLGGSGDDSALAIAVDSTGSAYVAGATSSPNFPAVDAAQPRLGGNDDAWVAKLNSSGTALVYSTYLGGGGADNAAALAIDASGAVYLTGNTSSADFPLAAPIIDELLGTTNIFAAKLGGGTGCAVSLGATSTTVPAAGGSGSIRVTAPSGCGWQATVDSGWVTLSGATGSGSGSVNYSVAANGTSAQRSATVNIQGQIFTIRQDAGGAPAAGTQLTSGQVVNWQLPAVSGGSLFNGSNGYRIVVPEGATRLDIVLKTNTAGVDTDLHVRLGADVAVANSRVVSDYSSTSDGGSESVSITAGSNPALRAGTYYIAIALYTTGTAVSGTLVATVETPAGGTAPAITSGGIVGAGSSLAANVCPGAPITIYGSGFGAAEFVASSVPLPTILGGVRVLVNGATAPLFYVGPKQINIQLPVDIQAGTAQAVVEVNGTRSASVSFTVAALGPGIIQFALDGKLRAVTVNEDGRVNTPSTPAGAGSIVTVYLTGAGPVKAGQPLVSGSGSPMELRWIASPYAVTVGGLSAAVDYIGLTPGGVGLYQMNLHVPELPPGDHAVSLTVGSATSNTPLIAVR